MDNVKLAKILILAISAVFCFLVYPFLNPSVIVDLWQRRYVIVLFSFCFLSGFWITFDYAIGRLTGIQ